MGIDPGALADLVVFSPGKLEKVLNGILESLQATTVRVEQLEKANTDVTELLPQLLERVKKIESNLAEFRAELPKRLKVINDKIDDQHVLIKSQEQRFESAQAELQGKIQAGMKEMETRIVDQVQKDTMKDVEAKLNAWKEEFSAGQQQMLKEVQDSLAEQKQAMGRFEERMSKFQDDQKKLLDDCRASQQQMLKACMDEQAKATARVEERMSDFQDSQKKQIDEFAAGQRKHLDECIAEQEQSLVKFEERLSNYQTKVLGRVENRIALVDEKLAGQKETLSGIRSTLDEQDKQFTSVHHKVNKVSRMGPVVQEHTEKLGNHTTKLETLHHDFKSHADQTVHSLSAKVDKTSFQAASSDAEHLRKTLVNLKSKLEEDMDALKYKLNAAEHGSTAHSRELEDLQAQLDQLFQMARNSSGGGFTAGYCISCSSRRSPSPVRHNLGHDGRSYNYVSHDDKGKVDSPSEAANPKHQRPASAGGLAASVRRNPHPSVQAAVLGTLARSGPGQYMEKSTGSKKSKSTAFASSSLPVLSTFD